MFENIIYFAYDFNINVNEALVRELEGTACAYRCWKRHDDGLADIVTRTHDASKSSSAQFAHTLRFLDSLRGI